MGKNKLLEYDRAHHSVFSCGLTQLTSNPIRLIFLVFNIFLKKEMKTKIFIITHLEKKKIRVTKMLRTEKETDEDGIRTHACRAHWMTAVQSSSPTP